jgi:hypothetical protein
VHGGSGAAESGGDDGVGTLLAVSDVPKETVGFEFQTFGALA